MYILYTYKYTMRMRINYSLILDLHYYIVVIRVHSYSMCYKIHVLDYTQHKYLRLVFVTRVCIKCIRMKINRYIIILYIISGPQMDQLCQK